MTADTTKFNEVHRRAIDGAFATTQRGGDTFCIIVQEPLVPLDAPFDPNETFTMVCFKRVGVGGRYEPARNCDHETINDWIVRHRDTPVESFRLPDFGAVR